MNKLLKKFCATLLSTVFIFTILTPMSAYSQPGTMGTEFPHLSAKFTNSTGDVCCGDALEAGEYNVELVLSGMSSVCLFQITADVTADITINSVSTISDVNSEFTTVPLDYEDNPFKLVIFSEADTAAVSSSGETMVTLNVTVNTPGDFENYFVLSTDPDVTFTAADYGDPIELSYVHISNPKTDEDYPNLTFDMSPDLTVKTFDVAGQVTIATNLDGTEGTEGIVGITASVEVNGEVVTATSDDNGYYTLKALPEGEYSVTFSGSTTVNRTAALTVSADKAVNGVITANTLPVNICDYVDSEKVDLYDKTQFNKVLNGEYDVYYDIVKSGKVDLYDKTMFNKFVNQDIIYADAAL